MHDGPEAPPNGRVAGKLPLPPAHLLDQLSASAHSARPSTPTQPSIVLVTWQRADSEPDDFPAPFEAKLWLIEDLSTLPSAHQLQHVKFGKLAMRLVRHIIRERASVKLEALAIVPSLLMLAGGGFASRQDICKL